MVGLSVASDTPLLSTPAWLHTTLAAARSVRVTELGWLVIHDWCSFGDLRSLLCNAAGLHSFEGVGLHLAMLS